MTDDITDEIIDAALHAVVPGGAPVHAWLPMIDGFTIAPVARNVMRSALSAALASLRAATVEECAKVADHYAAESDEHRAQLIKSKRPEEADRHDMQSIAGSDIARRIRALAPPAAEAREGSDG